MTPSPSSHLISRRGFLATGITALGLAPWIYLHGQQGSPNEEVAIGVIGCGAQGTTNMKNFMGIKGARVVAVCDVDSRRVAKAKFEVDSRYGNKDCKTYANYQELLQHSGLDAVCLATPDHWHAKIGIDAANAGKDIFGEKPFTWGNSEGRMLCDALTKNKCVWQTGSWQRSKGEFRRFRALVQNDTLGKITRYECGTPSGMSIRGDLPAGKVAEMVGKPPANLDWEAYCGPVGQFTYNPLVHPWNWRWHSTFGGGQLLDWVGHHVDIAMWTLGLDKTGPEKVEGTGKLGDHHFFNTYVDYDYQGTFADGRVIEVRSDFGGTKFTGENGWLHVNRGKLEASDRDLLRNLPDDFDNKPPSHWQNFIDCVRTREVPVSDAEGAHRAASFGQLALVAIDTKQPVKWDPKAEKVIGNEEQATHPRLGARVTV